MKSHGAVLLGSQTPRHYHLPPAATSSEAGREAVELAALAGLHLDPWQQLALETGCAERTDGKWAAFEVGLIVPRQNGKGSILEARELAGLFIFDERLILHSAHEFKTAVEAFRRVLFLIENTPELDARVKKVTRSHGDEGIELKSGARLRFVARTGGSGRGFTGDCIVLDEAYNLSPAMLAALLPTLSAVPNPQIWYTSSAPLDTEESAVLRGLCRRGRRGESPRQAHLEWCAADDADHHDVQAIADGNPALGRRITLEFVESEREAFSADPAKWARERLGIVDLSDGDEGWVIIGRADWVRCGDAAHRIPADVKPAYVVDVAPYQSHAAVAVSDGTQGEIVAYRPGTTWVVEGLVAHDVTEVAVDPQSAAGALIPDIEAAGITVRRVTLEEHAQACAGLVKACTDREFVHIEQAELTAAVANADRRDVGDGAWLFSRRRSTVDISPLVAVGLARWAALNPLPSEGFCAAWA